MNVNPALPVIEIQVDGRLCTVHINSGFSQSITSKDVCQLWTKDTVHVVTFDGETNACCRVVAVDVQLWANNSIMVKVLMA